MFKRRDVLKITLGGAAGAVTLARTTHASAQNAPAVDTATAPASEIATKPVEAPVVGAGVGVGPASDFQANTVTDIARELAKQPYKPISTDLPDPFKTLTYEQYAAIKLKPEARIWASENLGFIIEPLHRGFQFNNSIELNLVAQGKSYKLVYDVNMFDFGGKVTPSPKIGDINFSGFRVLASRPSKGYGEVANFQGANFFHALADGQVEGMMARALALKIGDPKGEEMPLFRAMWIEKPSLVANLMIVHALIDSDSVVGAFRFTIRPGEATIIDTECTLFPRKDVDNYGLATMSATHLLGFMDHKKFDDYRPNVSEVDGLQLLTGANEWVWRPVTNRDTLQISTFVDNKPRGFGCIMRDREFSSYDDEDQQWQRRPSLWIEPLGEWAEGGVQLIEIPSQSDANDNILSFWRPKQSLKAGQEMAFAYRQFWCWDPPTKPDLARAVRSRAGSVGKHRKFFVEFEGDILGDAARTDGLAATLTATNGSISFVRTYARPERKAFRVLFELDPGNAEASELRLLLEAKGKPISETWLYRWTPA